MSRPALLALALPVLCATLGLVAVGQKAIGRDAAAVPAKPVYESSIGGVVSASKLPGKAGQGYLVYSKWCAGCHAADFVPAGGKAAADKLSPISRTPFGTAVLRQRYQDSAPAVLDERTDLTPETISYFVRNGLNAMPSFRKTEITDTELDALSAYLSRSRNNKPTR